MRSGCVQAIVRLEPRVKGEAIIDDPKAGEFGA
jgi:hypothetical protein